jgi:hypothetical protein
MSQSHNISCRCCWRRPGSSTSRLMMICRRRLTRVHDRTGAAGSRAPTTSHPTHPMLPARAWPTTRQRAPPRTRTAGLTRKLRLGAQPPPQRHPHRRAGPSASWPACRCQRPEREGRSASTYRGSAPLDVAGCTSGRVSGAINAVVASWLYVRGLFRIPNLRLGPYDTFASSFRDVDDKGKVLARYIWKLQVLVCEIHLFRR